jgi:hypothetical protein
MVVRRLLFLAVTCMCVHLLHQSAYQTVSSYPRQEFGRLPMLRSLLKTIRQLDQ